MKPNYETEKKELVCPEKEVNQPQLIKLDEQSSNLAASFFRDAKDMTHYVIKGAILWVLCSLISLPGQCQWEQIPGLEGGVILSMATNDSLIFAGTTVGVYLYDLSENTPSWELFIAPPIPEVTALAICQDSLLIGTPEGLFISPLTNPVLVSYQKNLPGNNIGGVYMFPGEIAPDLAVYEKEFGLFYFLPEQKRWFNWNSGLPSNKLSGFIVNDATNWSGCVFWARINDTIYSSNVPGGIWSKWEPGSLGNPIEAMVVSENLFFAGTEEGIYKRDWLASWIPWDSTVSLPGIHITLLYKGSYSGDSVGLVAASPNHTIYFSKDHGTTWNQALLPPEQIYTITGFSAMKGHTLAYTDGGGILISDDLEHWETLVTGMNLADVRSVTSYSGNIIAGTHGAGIFRNKSGGGYEKINDGLASADITMVFDAGDYLVTCAGGAMYYMDDNDTWHDFSYNMHDRNPCVGISYLSTDIAMTMAKSTGIWSIDFIYDTVWHHMNQGIEGIGISDLTQGNGHLYVTTFGHGVFQYNQADTLPWQWMTDNGIGLYQNSIVMADSNLFVGADDGVYELNPPYEIWIQQNTGLTESHNIALEIHNGLIFGSFYPNNCYVANTSVMEWHDRSEGLPEYTFLWDLCIDGDLLYAGSNRSLWKRKLGDMNPGIREGKTTKTLLCYPNPCQNKVSIDTRHLNGEVLAITLFGLHGKTILEQLPNGSGNRIYSINVDMVPEGLYFIRIQTQKGIYSAKILKQ